MSLVTQIIREVTQIDREVNQQLVCINEFIKKNRDNIALVRTELSGSQKGYDQRVISSLTQAEASLTRATEALRRSSDALRRVRTV